MRLFYEAVVKDAISLWFGRTDRFMKPRPVAFHVTILSSLTLLFAVSLATLPVTYGADSMVISEKGQRLTIDTRALVLQLQRAPNGALLLERIALRNSKHNWAAKGHPAGINLNSDPLTLTGFSADQGFQHAGYSALPVPRGGTELQIRLNHTTSKLLATLSITAFPNSPVLDFCLRVQNKGDVPLRNLSRFDPLSLPLAARARPYRAHWVTRNSYALNQADVRNALTVDGGNWNGPNAAGWLAVEDSRQGEFLVAGIEWERHWAFDLLPENDGKNWRLSAGLRRACTLDLAPGATVESPHVFLGLASGNLDDAANTTRDYLLAHVLPPLPANYPYVSYDIWSTEQENVERRILDEADFAARKLGVEVFYHDASWYRDSDVTNKERWGVGLGSYTEDRRKLPNGLRHMSDEVHRLGMKFGLWVCPEMVDVTVQERENIPDDWMTMTNSQFNVQRITGWNPMKMLCTGSPAVGRHFQKNLLRIVDEFKLDWLKWDASGLPGLDIVCNRADHGHQAGNGSQAAVEGKYRILNAVRQKYPALILEQCSYGTRLDYGMGRHGARANWLSDSTAPSSHVRDNVMAAAYVLPGACNYTWIMRDAEVTQPQTPAFLDTMFRSRMMGGFGFGTLHGSLGECVSLYPHDVIEAAVRNVKNYKSYRHLLAQHVYHLSPWGKTNEWQAMQFASRDQREAVVFCFRNGDPKTERQFKLRGLDKRRQYEIVRLNTGAKELARGGDLMRTGPKVMLAGDPQESEILWLKSRRR